MEVTHAKRQHLIVCLVALLVVASGTAFGQEETGNCYVELADSEGNALLGVTVSTLTSGGAPKVQVSNTQGQVRFLSLSPDVYQMTAVLDGFSSVEYLNVRVSVGHNTTIAAQLSSAVEETVDVGESSPGRAQDRGRYVCQVELEKIPTARDPWSILSQASGVQVDRINVGGNESGQQSVFRGSGASDDENDFLVDGVQITDMAAIGNPVVDGWFRRDDVTKNTGGVSVNLVTALTVTGSGCTTVFSYHIVVNDSLIPISDTELLYPFISISSIYLPPFVRFSIALHFKMSCSHYVLLCLGPIVVASLDWLMTVASLNRSTVASAASLKRLTVVSLNWKAVA